MGRLPLRTGRGLRGRLGLLSTRVGILCVQHESNTFSPIPTGLGDFEIGLGEEIRAGLGASHHEVAGFLHALEGEGIEAVPLLTAVATPSGRIRAEALDALVEMAGRELQRAGPLDGLLVAAHGAAVSESHADADGYWVGLVRERMRPDVRLVLTVDAHANVSDRMVRACDALIAYRSNPHLDTFDRGVEAARLLARMLAGEVRPAQAAAFPPAMITILAQETAVWPCRPLYELAEQMRGRESVLAVSVCLGFPYADVEELGSSFVVVTDGAPDLARSLADELSQHLLTRRHDFAPACPGPEEAVEQAATSPGPVCLLDTGDNVGGGSAADGTTIAHIVHQRGGPRTFICLYDPESQARARTAGVGTRIALSMGGKSDDLHGPAITTEATVRSLHDGRFTEPEIRHGGRTTYDMGQTAVVETDRGLTVQLTSKRIAPFSLQQLLSCGIHPGDFQIVVAKGVIAPVPAYAPVCPTIIRAATPGSTTPDVTRLDFRSRRRPLFPFEDVPPT